MNYEFLLIIHAKTFYIQVCNTKANRITPQVIDQFCWGMIRLTGEFTVVMHNASFKQQKKPFTEHQRLTSGHPYQKENGQNLE